MLFLAPWSKGQEGEKGGGELSPKSLGSQMLLRKVPGVHWAGEGEAETE